MDKEGISVKFCFSDTREIKYLFKRLLAISIFFFEKFLFISKNVSQWVVWMFLTAFWELCYDGYSSSVASISSDTSVIVYSVFNSIFVLKEIYW